MSHRGDRNKSSLWGRGCHWHLNSAVKPNFLFNFLQTDAAWYVPQLRQRVWGLLNCIESSHLDLRFDLKTKLKLCYYWVFKILTPGPNGLIYAFKIISLGHKSSALTNSRNSVCACVWRGTVKVMMPLFWEGVNSRQMNQKTCDESLKLESQWRRVVIEVYAVTLTIT